MPGLKVGLCGLGTVGSGVFNTLQANAAVISGRAAGDIRVVHVGARRDNPVCDLSSVRVSRDIFEVARDPEVDVLVELIGGTDTARDLIELAIDQGKHIVTANKALIAEHGNALFARAAEKGVILAYEAAVAGGIPIIKALREGLAANNIDWLAGIINGTGNFILTEMGDKGRPFDEVLKEAQALGYAEADPTFDVEGIDAAHKLVILASLAFAIPLDTKTVFTEGISRLSTRDVAYAAELGYRIKHLGIARKRADGIELRVHPTLIPKEQVIANVDGVMNAIMVQGDVVGPTLYSGPGAGSGPTASSVISDLVDVSRQSALLREARVPYLGFHAGEISAKPVLSIEEVESEYYLRLKALDKPGVLASITSALRDEGISVEALIQKEPRKGENTVNLVLISSRCREKVMNNAIRAIEGMDVVDGEVVRIRVETLD